MQNEKLNTIYKDILKGINLCKESCDYFSVCGGGTPSNKYSENGTFISTETKHCILKFQKMFDVFLGNLETQLI